MSGQSSRPVEVSTPAVNQDEPGLGLPSRSQRTVVIGVALICTAGLIALGNWQLERRIWKHELINRVEARIHTTPVAAPRLSRWDQRATEQFDYLRVQVSGRFDATRQVLVESSTDLGAGYWVMTPLLLDDGASLLVNRGFAPLAMKHELQRDQHMDAATVTGLVRAPEPRCSLLRENAPAEGRWCSRDVAGIAIAHDLRLAAPYFIDAEAKDGNAAYPVALTRVRFSDNHLIYALTWYGLAVFGLSFAILAGFPRLLRRARSE
jgi:surfeit locus 1 family protein